MSKELLEVQVSLRLGFLPNWGKSVDVGIRYFPPTPPSEPPLSEGSKASHAGAVAMLLRDKYYLAFDCHNK